MGLGLHEEKMKIYLRFSIKKWFRVNKISLRLTISEPSSNQKSNLRELQYMNILLALAYHDRATFETFRQLEPSTTEFFLLVKYGSRFHYVLYSVWSYKKIHVQLWLSAQTGYWLALGPSDIGKPNLSHWKYNLVNL